VRKHDERLLRASHAARDGKHSAESDEKVTQHRLVNNPAGSAILQCNLFFGRSSDDPELPPMQPSFGFADWDLLLRPSLELANGTSPSEWRTWSLEIWSLTAKQFCCVLVGYRSISLAASHILVRARV
jgi:hypothetical protein